MEDRTWRDAATQRLIDKRRKAAIEKDREIFRSCPRRHSPGEITAAKAP